MEFSPLGTGITGIQSRREQESLTFPTGDGQFRTVQPLDFHHIMDKINVAGWQIIQKRDRLAVLLAKPGSLDAAALITDIRCALSAQGLQPPDVEIKRVAAIPRTPLGKAPLIMKAAS